VDEAMRKSPSWVGFLKDPKKNSSGSAGAFPRALLMVGTAGHWQNLLAKATPAEADASFFSNQRLGFCPRCSSASAASRGARPCSSRRAATRRAGFIDEIDAVGRSRGHGLGGWGNDEREQTPQRRCSSRWMVLTRRKVSSSSRRPTARRARSRR